LRLFSANLSCFDFSTFSWIYRMTEPGDNVCAILTNSVNRTAENLTLLPETALNRALSSLSRPSYQCKEK